MKTITLAQLKSKQACADQQVLFKELFGTSVMVTEEACVAVADKFDWGWAAQNLLSNSARDQYNKVCATAWSEHIKVCASTFARLYLAD